MDWTQYVILLGVLGGMWIYFAELLKENQEDRTDQIDNLYAHMEIMRNENTTFYGKIYELTLRGKK